MRKSEIVAKRLAEFSEATKERLEGLAKESNLLLPGQRLVFKVWIEDAPMVAEQTEHNSLTALLDMQASDFFTRTRFEGAGVESRIITRTLHALSGAYSDRELNSHDPYTVRSFIKEFEPRLRGKGAFFLFNAREKAKAAVKEVLISAGVWEE